MPGPDPATIPVVLNGAAETVTPGTTVAGVIDRFGLPDRGVAVEVSGEIVPRGLWSERELKPGDRIEIVRMVGGGN